MVRFIRTLLLAALVTALAVAWYRVLAPSFLGGPAEYVTISGESMEPRFSSGDLAIVRKQESYGKGDIIAYRVPKGEPAAGYLVIHRIVGGSEREGFLTQGDNREEPDLWRPTSDDIVGTSWFSVPLVGRGLLFMRYPLPLAALAGGFAAFLVFTGAPRRRRDDAPEALAPVANDVIALAAPEATHMPPSAPASTAVLTYVEPAQEVWARKDLWPNLPVVPRPPAPLRQAMP
ncbi:MAG: signal peptidase I [Dehalococcoidia bacterium]